MEPYPQLASESPSDMANVLRAISRERGNDISDFKNLTNVFIKGRKVAKVPTASNDVATGDRLGDFNYDADYLYILVDDSGAAWRRVAISSW